MVSEGGREREMRGAGCIANDAVRAMLRFKCG